MCLFPILFSTGLIFWTSFMYLIGVWRSLQQRASRSTLHLYESLPSSMGSVWKGAKVRQGKYSPFRHRSNWWPVTAPQKQILHSGRSDHPPNPDWTRRDCLAVWPERPWFKTNVETCEGCCCSSTGVSKPTREIFLQEGEVEAGMRRLDEDAELLCTGA